MRPRNLYDLAMILALLAAALPGCQTAQKCPPSFGDDRPGCPDLPACSRNRVYVFLLSGFDPLCGMDVLRDNLIECGFIKVYSAPWLYESYYVKEIQRLHQDDEGARFVIVAQGGASATARAVADAAGAPIDLMVFLDKPGEGPAHAQRVILVCGENDKVEDDKVAEQTVRLADSDEHDTAKHPQTAALIANELCSIAAKIPVVEVGPRCELDGCPPCGNGWDFLRPDGHDSGCVHCKPMGEAGGTPPATMLPAPEPVRKALPKPEKNAKANASPAANTAPTTKLPAPAEAKRVVLPPPPTRLPPPQPSPP